MTRSFVLLRAGFGLMLASVPLAGCVGDGYGYGVGSTWYSSPYSVYYDGYYGPLYDGYWGSDGYYYYRNRDQDNRYRRGDHNHFRRAPVPNDNRYHHYEGQSRQPSAGTRMPNYPRQDMRSDRDRYHSDDRRDNRD